MACNATLGNPRHVGENAYLVKVIEIFSDIDGKKLPDFKIDILRKKSEEELVEMEEKAGENLQSSVRKVDRWTTS